MGCIRQLHTLGMAALLCITEPSLAQTTLPGSRHDGPGRIAASTSTFGVGVSRDHGASYVSSAYTGEHVLIRGEIRPEPANIGQLAEIFVVDRLLDTNTFLMRTSSGAWVSWNGTVSLLQPFRAGEVLDAVETLDLFSGTVSVAGNHRFFLGYRPADGILRYHVNGLPLTLTPPLHAVGTLDTSFNATGQILTTFGTNDDVAKAMAIQTDGKIVVAGTSYSPAADFAVARYNTNGSLDTSFDTDGKLTTFLVGAGSADVAKAVVIQPDGKIVVGGSADNSFALVRYNTNGSLDTTFGTGGKVTTSILHQIATGEALALQADGKIVLAGSTNGPSFAVARYNTNGSLDTSFDLDGTVITSYVSSGGLTGAAGAVAIQTDGKILVQSAGGTSMNLVRFNTDGSMDTTFGTLGLVNISVPGTATTGGDVLVQPDGRIVVAGTVDHAFAIFRYDNAGNLETIFERTTGPLAGLGGIALQADGKVVMAGFARKYTSSNGDFVLRRYNTDGSIDALFGTAGMVTTIMSPTFGGTEFGGGQAVAIQADGRIVVAGSMLNGANTDFVIARYE